MSIKSLLGLRKKEDKTLKRKFFNYLVIGQDISTLYAYKFLVDKYQKEEVCLIAPGEFTEAMLTFKGPGNLRGDENVECFKTLYPNADVSHINKRSRFYKEQRFREFGSRSKSGKLYPGEAYYVNSRYEYEVGHLFPFVDDGNYIKNLNDDAINLTPCLITKGENESNWSVECTKGEIIDCNHLIWGDGPHAFYDIFDKEAVEVNTELSSFCESTRGPSALSIKLTFDKKLSSETGTVFLPLSQTYEMGHFIGEFGLYDEKEDCQEALFLHFIDKEFTSKAELAKRIKGLKKNLERIYSKYKKSTFNEYIQFSEQSPSTAIDDQSFEVAKQNLKNIFFIGQNAPLDQSFLKLKGVESPAQSITHLARELVSLEQFKEVFEESGK